MILTLIYYLNDNLGSCTIITTSLSTVFFTIDIGVQIARPPNNLIRHYLDVYSKKYCMCKCIYPKF